MADRAAFEWALRFSRGAARAAAARIEISCCGSRHGRRKVVLVKRRSFEQVANFLVVRL
jgi:hypothetical protein